MKFLSELSSISGLEESRILQVITSADDRYKTYNIPKKGGGSREINQPSAELKDIQRWVTERYLKTLPCHPAATAYEAGSSIKVNAEHHRSNQYITRIDFSDFFPSFEAERIDKFLSNHMSDLDINESDAVMIRLSVCRQGRLTIGAPSSPSLTNCMMFEFDEQITNQYLEKNITYTRYADDLYFSSSSPDVMWDVCSIIEEKLADIEHLKLRINVKKNNYMSKKYRRVITGLIISDTGQISLGRSKKRLLSAKVHNFMQGNMSWLEIAKLGGALAYANDIEPSFIIKLRSKYGEDNITGLLRNRAAEELEEIWWSQFSKHPTL